MSPRERRAGDLDPRQGKTEVEADTEELSLPDSALASSGNEDDEPVRLAVDALIAEARTHLDVRDPDDVEGTTDVLGEMDWSRLESRLMASVELEKPALIRDVERTETRGARFLRAGAFALAAAAAVAMFVRRDRDVALDGAHSTATTANDGAPASSLRTTEGSGEVRIGGVVAAPGYVVRAGDTIEVAGDGSPATRGVFERAHKVAWLIEQPMRGEAERPANEATRARVKSAGEALVLGLEHGVIEAQVVPVPSGEAFAVDIATEQSLVRVAVHGTHLRVARSGNRVVVDLTEGVIAIGVPPRTGVTIGTTVAAPAHVELDATDLTTLRIDHAPGSVRAAIPLWNTADVPRPETMPPAQTAQVPPAPITTVTKTGPTTREAAVAVKLDPPKVQLPAREAIAVGVRECAAARGRSGEVHVTVNSSLRLNVSPTGVVESAVFSPPLSPDVQTCAAQVIYKVKLEETGLVTIPIEFSY